MAEENGKTRREDERPVLTSHRIVTTRLELPYRTIARVILTVVLLWLLVDLWSILLLLIIGLLLTAALYPPVLWLERHGFSRGRAVAAIFFGLLALVALILVLAIPPIVEEGTQFAQNLPEYVQKSEGILQSRYPSVYQRLEDFAQRQAEQGLSFSLPVPQVISVGAGIVQGLSNTLIVLVMTAYLLTGGERIYRWSVRYLPDHLEARVRQTLPEISRTVSGYALGQLTLSTSFGIFTFIVLSATGVPQPVFLALMAAFMDAIPMIGVVIATIPAVLLALTQGWVQAVIVFAAYMIYQQIENYLIAPRVYGERLQISAFAILLAVLIGGELLGILGIFMALPLAAAVPAIERIWIAPLRAKARQEPSPAVGDDG
ncbi:MAG TPA: AI-2E family transporter [Thermomicrobiales bacterium]|nr:AI-2E family transporter [Thermomicrobiales bacterium]